MPVTRLNFLKGALALAGSGMGGALSVPALMTLLPPPVVRCNSDEAYDTLLFKERSRARGTNRWLAKWHAKRTLR